MSTLSIGQDGNSDYQVVLALVRELFNLDELYSLRDVILERIEIAKDEVKAAIRQRFQDEIDQAGLDITAEELFGVQPRRKGRPAKYHNPDNLRQTWSGAGKRPLWFIQKLGEGLSAEQMEINPLEF